MGNLFNAKILGATLVGLILVGGAHFASGYRQPEPQSQTAANTAAEPLKRVAIAVEDRDNNGIEDWRDAFVTNEPIIVSRTVEEYEPPETMTGKTSVQLLRGLIEGRMYAPVAPNDEEVVENTIDKFRSSLETKIYDRSNIEIIDNWEIEDVVNYANTVAAVVYRHNLDTADNEIFILEDIVKNNNSERIPELEAIASVYKNYVADTLSIPVPDFLAKQHLDLINSYQSVHEDISGMTLALSDPLKSIAFSQRYLGSTEALRLSFTNIYHSLVPFAEDFTTDDPAVLFVVFSPDYQPQI